jgi:hypothetical protein
MPSAPDQQSSTPLSAACCAASGARDLELICPTGSVRDFVSSPLAKNISLLELVEAGIEQFHPVPIRGAFRDRHGRWARDAVDAAAPGAHWQSQGGFLLEACERSSSALTNGAVSDFAEARRTGTKPGEAFGEDGSRTAKPCGPGTRCWCQVGGGASARPGLDKPLIR